MLFKYTPKVEMLCFLFFICNNTYCASIPDKWINKTTPSFSFSIQNQTEFGEFWADEEKELGKIIVDNRICDQELRILPEKTKSIMLVDTWQIKPKNFDDFLIQKTGFFSEEEILFHRNLHSSNDFDELILRLQEAGIRYYSPSKETDVFLINQSLKMKKQIQQIIPTARTLQKLCLESIETLINQAEGIQKIKNKTYCICGVRLDFSDTAQEEDIKNCFFLLPYVFISDGMDSEVITSMNDALATSKGYFKLLKNIDYYSMDIHDTASTIKRVHNTMLFSKHNYMSSHVCSCIIDESSIAEEVGINEIRKFAHAEQRALDRVSIMLPDFITEISKSVENQIIIKGIRINMLVNNDSCSRCDAVIKMSIEKKGWLERLLISSIQQSIAFSEKEGHIIGGTNFNVTAAVSSKTPYNTGMDLGDVSFSSRGGIEREVGKIDDNKVDLKNSCVEFITKKESILKIYECK